MLGRHHKALEKLGLLFKQGRIAKTYWAVVEGEPEADTGLIDLPLGRLDATRGWWMKVDPQGLPSSTRFTVMGRANGRAALALEPLTGRTHQLRVHCAAMGWPIPRRSDLRTARRGRAACISSLARSACRWPRRSRRSASRRRCRRTMREALAHLHVAADVPPVVDGSL